MSFASEFLNSFIRDKLLTMHTTMPCKVISYDESTKRATVQPLYKTKEYDKPAAALPVIEDVPVLTQRFRVNEGEDQEYTPVYQVGDVVFVAFSERSLDAVMAAPGQIVLPDSARHHSLNDAVILGVLDL